MLNNNQARLFTLCNVLAVCGLLFGCNLGSDLKAKPPKTHRARFRGATTTQASDDITISSGDTAWLAPGEKLTLLASTKLQGAQLKWEGIVNGNKTTLSQDANFVFEAPALAYPCETKEVVLTASATVGQTVRSRATTVLVQNKSCLLNETTGLSSNDTTKLLVAKDKSLYVGSRNGLTRFNNGETTKLFAAGNNETLQIVTALAESDSIIYVGKARKLGPYPVKGFGVDKLHFEGSRYRFDPQAIFTGNYVSDIFFTHSGNALLPEVVAANNYTNNGVVHRPVDLKSAAGNAETGNDLLKGESLYTGLEYNGRIYYAGDGGIWEYQGDKFIERFDGSEWNGKGGFLGVGSNRSVRALAGDNAGNIWVGLQSGIMASGGLIQFRPSTSDKGPSWTGPINLVGAGNDVRALAVDSWDNLWIATDNGLVQRSSNGTFTNFGATSGLPSNDIRDLAYDEGTGNLWIATGAGVERWSLAQLR